MAPTALRSAALPPDRPVRSDSAAGEVLYFPARAYSGKSGKDRSFGVILTCAFHALALGAFVVHWGVSYVQQDVQTLSVFDVAPPAAPPEPPSEVPPGPEQVEREKPLPRPERAKIEPPLIQMPSLSPITIAVPQEVPDPGPPIEKITVPERKPAPPQPQVSEGKPTWEGRVLAALNKAKRYPRAAQFARQQGVPWIRFVMDREGKVLSVTLERSSGFASLDSEAVTLPRRAQPLPKPPEDVKGGTIELVVPVEFFLR